MWGAVLFFLNLRLSVCQHSPLMQMSARLVGFLAGFPSSIVYSMYAYITLIGGFGKENHIFIHD